MNIRNFRNILKSGKRLVQVLLVLFLLMCILAVVGWHIIKTDHPYVIDKIQNTALEKWNAEIELDGYELEWTQFLSQLKLRVNGVNVGTSDKSLPSLLKINQVTSEINLWDLKTKDFHRAPVHIDSIWIHIYNDSIGNSNMAFRKAKHEENRIPTKLNTDIKGLPPIYINYLDFHNQKIALDKWQKFQLSQVDIKSQILENGEVSVHLLSDCFFDGLVFNEKEGGYLLNTQGKLDVNVGFNKEEKKVVVNNTTLSVGQNKYNLEGYLSRTDSTEMQLKVSTAGVKLEEVMPLLSKKINYVCRKIKVDQPVQATFSMIKNLSSKNKPVIQVDFQSNNTRLKVHEGEMTAATFSGQFTNDCDNDGIGVPSEACLQIYQMEGDLLGMIPMKLHGEIINLKNPKVNIFGDLNIDMPRLNPLLASQDKFTFTNGSATFNFHFQGGLKNLLDSPFENLDIKLDGKATFDDLKVEQSGHYASWPSLSGRMHFTEDISLLDDIFFEWMGANIHIKGQLGNLPEYLLYDADALNSDLKLKFDVLDYDQFHIKKSNEVNPQSKNQLTPENFEKLFRRIATNINGNIQIQVDTFLYKDIFVTDYKSSFQLLTPRNTEYIDSSMIRMDKMTANFMGHTYMSLDMGLSHDTLTDLWLDLKVPNTSQACNLFLPENIEITEGDASIELKADIPFRSLFKKKELFENVQFVGALDVEDLTVGIDEFDFPMQKISGPIYFDNNQVSFENLHFKYENSPFELDGIVSDYFFLKENNSDKSKLELSLKGNHFDLRNFTSREVLPTPANLFRSLDTVFHLTTGTVDVVIDSIFTKEDVITSFLLQAELGQDDQNPMHYQLVVDSLNFGFGPENNVNGRALISNPDYPEIDAHFKTRMKFDKFGKILPSDFLEFKDGYFKMDLDYHSSLLDSITAENYLLNAKVDGSVQIVDGGIFYNYRHFEFTDINADLKFDQKALSIQNLDMLINGNRLISSGESKDFFPFFILPNRKAHIKLDVASPYFDLGSFITPHEIEQKKSGLPFMTVDTTESVLSNTGNILDELLHKGSLEMSTDIKVLALKNFQLDEIKGMISLQPDSVHLHNLTMDFAKGNIFLDGVLSGVVLHNPIVELNLKVEETDKYEMMQDFEGFGLTNFGAQNLKGLASADVQFKADIDSKYSILPESMQGDVQLQLYEGELIKVKALEDLSGFLFRDRNLDHIQFDTLDALVRIRGNDMYLEKTQLHSSSFDFEVEGIYNLNSFDSTQVLLTIPFSNLYRRHISLEALRNGDSRRKGLPILIEGRSKKKRLRFRWKLFNSKKNKAKYRLPEE